MPGTAWTEEQFDVFHRMRLDGKHPRKIAEAIGRTEGAVRRMAVSLGLTFKFARRADAAPPVGRPKVEARCWQREFTPKERARVLELFAAYASRREIGKFLRINDNDVTLICRFNGLGDEYAAAMKRRKSRKGVTTDRVDIGDKAWRKLATQGSEGLLRRQLETGIHWLPERLAA